MTAGLSLLGFTSKTVQEIIGDLQAYQAANIASGLNTSSTGVLANINMSVALQLGQLWELAAEIYDAHDPATAEGVAADHNGSLTGVTRLPATSSTATLTLTMTENVTVPTGSVVSDPLRPTVRFVTLADVTSSSVVGTYNNLTVAAKAETTGPTTAASGALTKIESPVSGWLAVTNTGPAIAGSNVETDEDYRARRNEVLAEEGGSTLAGIVADVRVLPGVLTAAGRENTTEITDPTGMPPHTFEIIVRGGDDSAIANSIWKNKPAGVDSYGTTSINVLDEAGITQLVRFSRPTLKTINVNVSATTDGHYVAGSLRVALELASVDPKSDIVFKVGEPVYLVRLLSEASEVPGVVNVTLDVDLAPTVPTDAVPTTPAKTLAIGVREIASFSGSTWVGAP
jgi:uncharacterized phage protein gp47/JayE